MNGNSSKIKFKWNVFAFLLGFCALLLVILWLFQTVLLDSFYKTVKTTEVKNAVNEIVKNIDDEDLQARVDEISNNSGVNLEVIISGEKTTVVTSEDTKDTLVFPEKMLLLKLASENGGEYFFYATAKIYSDELNKPDDIPPQKERYEKRPLQALAYVKLTTTLDGAAAGVIADAVITPLTATVNTLRYQLYVITAIMLCLSVALAFVIAKRVSKPIENISKSAMELAKGNYDAEFSERGFKEIASLSDTLNAAARELGKTESIRRELLANVSHDLRTPLALIYGYAEVMHDFPDEITSEQTETIMQETKRLSSLVDDILDITRIESGREQLKVAEYNITRSLRATTKRVSELLKKDNYKITFKCDRQIRVAADEVKITQAYYNLLINAVNYTGSDKKIDVRQTVENGTVRISVTDTGEGIAKENLPNIWERYYKVDKTHKRAVTGTGLGLSIVKKIIELHGGEYGVESAKGEGSTFWFSLKLTENIQ